MNEIAADVLIVGAGPTGLALANALARLGTSCLIIEAKDATSIHTKATNLMPGTLEQLDAYGLTQRMYDTGGIMTRYIMYMYGTNVGPREMHIPDTPHPNVLFLGQDLIERNLREALPQTGNEILFSHKLTALTQDATGVTAVIDAAGNAKTLRFKYVVGCDGPRSATRAFSKCDFEPVRTGKYVWQADAKLSWKGLRSMKQMWLYYYDEGFGAVIHLPGDLTKVMVFEEKGRLPERQPTLAEIEQRLRVMSGDNTATLSDAVWLSHGELLTGVAPALIDERIILAGDACNPILPNGGQGLNVGIQDSLNLAWKLHDVIQGYATPALLETYNDERRANRLALEKVQINTLKYTLPAPALNRLVLRKFGNALLNQFWPLLAKVFSQLTLSYPNSKLSLDRLGKKGIGAGHRLLDADVVRATDCEEISLFRELSHAGWKAVLFDNGDAAAQKKLSGIAALPWIKSLIISTRADAPSTNAALYYDLDHVAHKTYRIKEPTILLFRPDNYIAVRVSASGAADIERYLRTWYANAMNAAATAQQGAALKTAA